MNLDEAQKVCESAFPGRDVKVTQAVAGRGAYRIDVDGEMKGRNFDLMKACQEACLPILEKAREDHIANEKAKVEVFRQFGLFLQEKFKDEFEAWLAAQPKPE